MPFQSKSQLVACLYAQERNKHKKGKKSKKAKWDCMEFLEETPNFDKLPWKTGCKAKKTTKEKYQGHVVHIGPKGGKYIMKDGKKVYVR